MSYPAQYLQAVQTYQAGGLAFLQNQNVAVATANTKFKDFEKLTANLGSTVTFDRPPRFVAKDGLVISFQAANQLVQSLTVDRAKNISFAFTNQEYLFNAEAYMDKFNEGAVMELSATVEADIWSVIETNTYRAFGSFTIAGGVSTIDPINSFGQLAKSLTNYRDFGSPANQMLKYYLPLNNVSDIVNSGLNQFTLDRNNKMAMDWEVGKFGKAMFYESNLLPIHIAGTVGNTGADITVVSIDSTKTIITATTTNGATLLAGDIVRFNDGVAGKPNMRFLAYVGHKPTGQRVDARVVANATADGTTGAITFTVYPALINDLANPEASVNNAVVAGMKLKAFPDHRCGLIVGGDARYLAMPKMFDEYPYPTSSEYDADTGVAMRVYYGSLFGQNERGFVCDLIYGTTMVDDYVMRVMFPTS